MSHTLVEVAEFTEPIIVPDGTDSMVAAAETVAAIAQALANRSRVAQEVTDDAARKSVSNTFTATNTFNAATTLASATVTGGLQINGAISAADGGVNVSGNLVVASAVQSASLAVTGGAQINGSISAADGTVNISGNAAIASALTAASLHTAGPIEITNAAGDVTLTPTVIRWVNIPMSSGRPITNNAVYDELFDSWSVDNAPVTGPATVRFPVLGAPRGAPGIGIEAVWRAHAIAAANSLELFANTQAAWSASSGALVAPTDPVSVMTLSQSVGFSATDATHTVLIFGFGPHTVDNSTSSFYVDVLIEAGPNNALYGLRTGYYDPGARNG